MAKAKKTKKAGHAKIIRLQAENVKRLRAVEIKADGNVVIVGGRNAQGKTSVLDSIMYAFAGQGTVCKVPIRRGERKASVRVELNSGLVVERSFTENGSYLKVTTKGDDRAFQSPQAMLDKLTGTLTFDPLAFVGMAPKDQAETLRAMSGLDFAKLDAERAQTYSDRRDANADVRLIRTRLDGMPDLVEVPEGAADSEKVGEQLKAAMAHNEKRADHARTIRRMGERIQENDAEIESLTKRIAELRNARNDWARDQGELVAAMEKMGPERDLTKLQQAVADLAGIAKTVEANNARAECEKDLTAATKKANALDKRIADIDAEKAKSIAASKLPVKGLTFDEDAVLYKGVPFDQASSAEQLVVSLEITASMNPHLRVVLCRDASLLDDDSMKLIAKFAKARDYQVWMERVGADDECSVVIEDGAIAE